MFPRIANLSNSQSSFFQHYISLSSTIPRIAIL